MSFLFFAGMWNLSAAMSHIDNCLRAGEELRVRGMGHFGAAAYDKAARQAILSFHESMCIKH